MKTYILWVFGASLLLGTGAFSLAAGTEGMPPAASASLSAGPTPSNARIRIISPLDRAIVPIGQNKVEIATENLALDAESHWKLYLDGELIGTFEKGVTSFTLPIGVSGPHEIKAMLSDVQNDELASASIQVTAAPETPSSSPFNLPWVAPAMAVLLIGVAALIAVGLRVKRNETGTGGRET